MVVGVTPTDFDAVINGSVGGWPTELGGQSRAGSASVGWCRKLAWSSPLLSLKAVPSPRWPASTGSPKAGFPGSSRATGAIAPPRSSPVPETVVKQ